MTTPHYLFMLLLAILIGVIFHLWQGGNGGKLLLYVVCSILGFFTGQVSYQLWPFEFLSIGPMRIGMAIIASIVFMFSALWLSNIDTSETDEF